MRKTKLKRSDSEEDDDRKPPAKIVHVPRQKTPVRRNSEDSPNVTASGETSLASNASLSVNWSCISSPPQQQQQQPPFSPVARAAVVPRNNDTTPALLYTPQNKKNRKRTTSAPSLTAATPFSPVEEDDDDECKKPAADTDETASSSSSPAAILSNLQTHVILWLGTVAVSVAVFLYQILPVTALYTLAFILASLGMLTQTVVSGLRQLYRRTVIVGNGLQDILPASLFEMLTVTSIHEYMTDPSFMLEYRHLLLYFLPLTEEQLDTFLSRLSPAHIERLYRPGLGHFLLGENAMRIVLGQEQFLQQEQQHENLPEHPAIQEVSDGNDNNDPHAATTPVIPRQRLLLDDDSDYSGDSDLGLNVTSNDLAGGIINHDQAVSIAARLGLDETTTPTRTPVRTPPAPPPSRTRTSAVRGRTPAPRTEEEKDDDDNEDYADQELQVLTDAFTDSFYGSVYNPIRNYFSQTIVVPSAMSLSNLWLRFSTIVTLSATGLGIWGFWSGIYTLPTVASLSNSFSSARNNARSHYPPSWGVWTTALVGGTSIGLALYTRHTVRRDNLSVSDDVNDDDDNNNNITSDKKTPQKSNKKG